MNRRVLMNRSKRNQCKKKRECNKKYLSKYIEYVTNDMKQEIVNITNDIQLENYLKYQIDYANKNTILIAHRTTRNRMLFEDKCTNNENIIAMYNGKYVCFSSDGFENGKELILKLLDDDMDVNCDSCDSKNKLNSISNCDDCKKYFCSSCLIDVTNEDTTLFEDNNMYIQCPNCDSKKGLIAKLN